MTVWAFKTIIIPAALVAQARNIGACLDAAGSGMYTTPLSADGKAPVTHYISSGLMSAAFMPLLNDAALMFAYAQQGAVAQGLTLTATQEDCTQLVAQSDVSEDNPFDALARLGLKMVGED